MLKVYILDVFKIHHHFKLIFYASCHRIIGFYIHVLGNFFPPTLNLNGCTPKDGFKFPERDLVDYAVGAPNVINKQGVVAGAVYLCPNCFRESGDTISLHSGFELTLNGFQFGERFGQTVLSIDINGDCYDDIVVGAPLHSTDTVISSFIEDKLFNMLSTKRYHLDTYFYKS